MAWTCLTVFRLLAWHETDHYTFLRKQPGSLFPTALHSLKKRGHSLLLVPSSAMTPRPLIQHAHALPAHTTRVPISTISSAQRRCSPTVLRPFTMFTFSLNCYVMYELQLNLIVFWS